jgi:predicted transcriptional regulator
MTEYTRFCHAISKQARSEIIKIMLRGRSQRELARLLGITPPAVIKYLRETTHPSDEVICRALSVASVSELIEIKDIIINDLIKSLTDAYRWALEAQLLEPNDISLIEDMVSRVRLSSLGTKSISIRGI